jgi:uroporphyrinogen decarboxylase
MNSQQFAPLQNDLILRAALGQPTERVPVWIMRQAGRYLPEYNEVKGTADFFTVCRTKELAAEITIQPIRRFSSMGCPLDAAIIFTDILVVPQALGMEVQMLESKGPSFPSPLVDPKDLEKLDSVSVAVERLQYVFDAITLTRTKLNGEVPLIGFSGAPWTLMAYMIEGGGSKTYNKAKSWLYNYPEATHCLMQRLTDVIIVYLIRQIEAGAQLLQIFDSWAAELSPQCFETFSLPYLNQIAREVKAKYSQVPLIIFPKGANYSIEWFANDSESKYDVIGLDWTISPSTARAIVKDKKSLQGNLDPCVLFASKEKIRDEVKQMLEGFGTTQRLIGNLGHGLTPSHKIESVAAFIEAIRDLSLEMNSKNSVQQQQKMSECS